MKILMILTNVSESKPSRLETGFHFAEFSHAYEFFISHGYEVMIASPSGGNCRITSDYPGDKINEAFKSSPSRMRLIQQTRSIADVKGEPFDALYIAGGHGAMYDLANNQDLAEAIRTIYSAGGVIASVCHGPAGLVGVRGYDGRYLVDDIHLTSFTNKEEKATAFYNDMPFLLETKLVEQGAIFEESDPRTPRLVIDSNIITGQNPESIELVVGAIHTLLTVISKEQKIAEYAK